MYHAYQLYNIKFYRILLWSLNVPVRIRMGSPAQRMVVVEVEEVEEEEEIIKRKVTIIPE